MFENYVSISHRLNAKANVAVTDGIASSSRVSQFSA